VPRVFIGVPVDQSAQRRIAELLKPVKKSIDGVRWVPEKNLHLTLAFLGNRSPGVIENLIRSMEAAYRRVTSFQTPNSMLMRFPKPSGNIIALNFETDAQLTLLFGITQELLAGNGLVADRTPFKPHVTLGRIRKPPLLNTTFNLQTNIKLRVDRITLYQSTLTSAGSIYLALNEIELGQPDDRHS